MVDAIVNLLFENLKSLILNEFQLLGGVKKDMEKLQSIIQRIRLIIPNGEAKAFRDGALKDWLTKLSDAAYDADDILSDWAVEDQQVSNTFFPLPHFKRNTFRHNIGTRIKEILETFNSIEEERQKFKLDVTTPSPESEERTPTFSLVNENEIYGRDEDKEKIVKLLLTDLSNENDVPVIAIVGMGGLGKTTLAQLAYNDERVKGHFELRMWVYVSQNFDVTTIVKAILESATGSSTVLTQLDVMQNRLRDVICEKRFLLVLDDVWNENTKKWDDLKNILTCTFSKKRKRSTFKGKGSKIVVTTRKQTVASIMGALHRSLNLTGLSDSDCLSLFDKKAFEPGESKEHPNLVRIGIEIVKKCGGVPLAVKALGSLLRQSGHIMESFARHSCIPHLVGSLIRIGSQSFQMRPMMRTISFQIGLWKLNKRRAQVGVETYTFFPCFHFQRCIFRHKIGTRVKEILETFNSIAEENQKFKLEETTRSSESEERTRTTFSLVNEKEVYGRDEDKKNIVKLLLTDVSSENDVPVIAIVGMGGLGKTTLAQLAYNDERVKGNFELRMWVYVSQNFVVTTIVKAILESATGSSTVLTQLDVMQNRLRDVICEKRFLLVLDDVWNEDSEKWDDLKKILTCRAKGSKIVVTTRKQPVASIMGVLHESPHLVCLSGLSNSDCWSLFEKKSFEPGESKEHPNLVKIGEEIVEKCGGVPLAAKALGSSLLGKREEPSWLSVRDSQIWELKDDKILPALRLSYTNLPSHLRQCFSFCSVFPKGYEIVKEELICMWKANGFVTPKVGMELEDVGNEIFNDLLWRSFFQYIDKEDRRNITRCKIVYKMHDLVHDLARSVIVNKCYIVDSEKTDNIPPSTRYVYSLSKHPSLYKAKDIRTLLLPLKSRENWILRDIEKFRYLRWLDLSRCDVNPHSICNLKQLRYLSLSCTNIETLPKSIIYLQNLQTLKLLYSWRVRNLPPLGQLPSLENLEIRGMVAVKQINQEFYGNNTLKGFSFPSLKRLSLWGMSNLEMWASVEKGGAFPCLNELKIENCPKLITLPCFVHLTSVLISNLHEMSSFPESFLQHGNALQHLKISYCLKLRSFPRELDNFSALKSLIISYSKELVSLPEGLRNLTSLEKLEIEGCESLISLAEEGVLRGLKSLQSLGFWICGKLVSLPDDLLCLTTLQNLDIGRCGKLASLPDGLLRHLKSLQSLVISKGDKLVSLWDDVHHLTALQNLDIGYCRKLESLPDGLQHVTTLQHLSIEYCWRMQNLPEWVEKFTLLRSLTIKGCDNMTSLPSGLQHLTALQRLTIYNCPNLMRRCERERGEDWHKIAHVPDITIF
ncbi:uncharacterized protein LOC143859003 [Tasmannia lanceolata]|uniref:uncharacterized protein LOC143859003 n=1 Tax=Tasmannia lanceolata TaxID=3420 RepID=UPI00406350DD